MPEHKVQRRKSIRFFNDLEMRAVWDNNHYEWWVSVLEIFCSNQRARRLSKDKKPLDFSENQTKERD